MADSAAGDFRSLSFVDPANIRRAWGNNEQCRAAFAELKHSGTIDPIHGKAVVTLHGLGHSRNHMATMGSFLEKEGGYTWIERFLRQHAADTLDQHAQSLARVIEGLDGIDEINFVCHSLGNLVVRHYLGEAAAEEPRWKVDPRIKRMVMLGPPNNSEAKLAEVLADVLNDNDLAWFVAGPSTGSLHVNGTMLNMR